jgi:hypothetical protein
VAGLAFGAWFYYQNIYLQTTCSADLNDLCSLGLALCHSHAADSAHLLRVADIARFLNLFHGVSFLMLTVFLIILL